MNIDVRSDESLYIEINGWTYYIDDSTDEQIIKKWRDEKNYLNYLNDPCQKGMEGENYHE